jgi:hypothetical protein
MTKWPIESGGGRGRGGRGRSGGRQSGGRQGGRGGGQSKGGGGQSKGGGGTGGRQVNSLYVNISLYRCVFFTTSDTVSVCGL